MVLVRVLWCVRVKIWWIESVGLVGVWTHCIFSFVVLQDAWVKIPIWSNKIVARENIDRTHSIYQHKHVYTPFA